MPDWLGWISYFLITVGVTLAWAHARRELRRERVRSAGRLRQVKGLSRQNQELINEKRALEHAATHDRLTALPNRALLEREMERFADGDSALVLFMDLDRFKRINDDHGYQAGDEVLKVFASRCRESVKTPDVVGRWGGDECVVLARVPDAGAAQLMGGRLRNTLSRACRIPTVGTEIDLSVSIGMSFAEGPGVDLHELLRQAQIAAHEAKHQSGDGQVQLYGPDLLLAQAQRQLRMERLHKAVQAGQYELGYTLIVDAKSRQPIGVETSFKKPEADMDELEETGDIDLVYPAVLGQAAVQVCGWNEFWSYDPLWLAVNVSPSQLESPYFFEQTISILEMAKLPPECLKLEITERRKFTKMAAAQATLTKLFAARIRVELDDYPTGENDHNRLLQLANFVDGVKIDQSLVRRLPDPEVRKNIRQLLETAQTDLFLAVTAEGVESEEKADILTSMGCNSLQGFLNSGRYRSRLTAEQCTEVLGLPTR